MLFRHTTAEVKVLCCNIFAEYWLDLAWYKYVPYLRPFLLIADNISGEFPTIYELCYNQL